MTYSLRSIFGLVLTMGAASTAFAASHTKTPEQTALEMRHNHMQLYAFNLGSLGAMAKGEMEYDAEAAGAAAGNIAALASINQRGYWLDGTAAGEIDDSRALPKLFEDREGLMEKQQALIEASATMETAAGESLDSLKEAMGPLGKACGGCHETYRQSDN